MRKLYFISMLVTSICLFSCDKEEGNLDVQSDFVEITLGSENNAYTKAGGTRAEVTGSGVTNWRAKDIVGILDIGDEDQKFAYTLNYPNTDGVFTGKLRGQQGERTYYSYHTPAGNSSNYTFSINSDAAIGDGRYILDITYNDLDIYQKDDVFSYMYGESCPMVGLPLTFDVNEDYDIRPRINFYHATGLIEARITHDKSEENPEIFNRIVLSVEAKKEKTPFNTKIQMYLDKIVADPVNIIKYDNVGSTMTGKLQTTVNLKKSVALKDMMGEQSSYYSIPIFALPTEETFDWDLYIEFYKDEINEGVSSARITYSEKPVMKFKFLDGGYCFGINPSSLSDFGINEAAHKINLELE